jgi:TRAP-type C4-dicarboxylate transport system permease small subunit
VIEGSWKMTELNADSLAPATNMPLSMIYGTGIVMGIGMAVIVLLNMYRAVTNTVDIDDLTRTQESEELLSSEGTSPTHMNQKQEQEALKW